MSTGVLWALGGGVAGIEIGFLIGWLAGWHEHIDRRREDEKAGKCGRCLQPLKGLPK